MKSEIRQLRRDVKAAALLGRPEAIDIALNGLLAFPGVAANATLEGNFITKVILPIGQELAALPADLLKKLQEHPLAAGRAIAASALANHYLQTPSAGAELLHWGAADQRSEVRQALAETLAALANRDPERLVPLVQDWLNGQQPRKEQTALTLLPALADFVSREQCLDWLQPLGLTEQPQTRAALVACLQTIAQQNKAECVLKLLTHWAALETTPTWVITRTLAGAWAAQFPGQVRTLMLALQAKYGLSSEISNAWRALERHGLNPAGDSTAHNS